MVVFVVIGQEGDLFEVVVLVLLVVVVGGIVIVVVVGVGNVGNVLLLFEWYCVFVWLLVQCGG